MARLEKQQYKAPDVRTKHIEGFTLMKADAGISIYNYDAKKVYMVVAIRGTDKTDSADWYADSLIVYESLKDSGRYKHDKQVLVDFQKEYPQTEYEYYGVGHSLGGAILDQFIDDKLVYGGISFNSAIQTKDLKLPWNSRIYAHHDPLWYLFGQYSMESQRLPEEPSSWSGYIADTYAYINPTVKMMKGVYDYLYYHKMERFLPEGGGHHCYQRLIEGHGMPKDLFVRIHRWGGISMSKKDFVKEHENLLDVLEYPTPKKLRKEYTKQKRELQMREA